MFDANQANPVNNHTKQTIPKDSPNKTGIKIENLRFQSIIQRNPLRATQPSPTKDQTKPPDRDIWH